MIRFLVVEILFPLLVLFLVRAIFRSLFTSFRTFNWTAANPGARSNPKQPPPVSVGGELKKDPVCGTYVSTSASVTRSVNGHLVHFCSEQCRDKYRVA